MRCYFMRNGRIENVHLLDHGNDEFLIEQAKRIFLEHNGFEKYDGFEVWSERRFVYRGYLQEAETTRCGANTQS